MADFVNDFLLEPISDLFLILQGIAPGFLKFLVVIIIGYFMGMFVGWIARRLLVTIKIDKKLRTLDLHDSMGNVSLAKIFGLIAKWYIFTLFLSHGAQYLELGYISNYVYGFAAWLPNLFVSVIVIIIGLILIDFVINKMLGLKSRYIQWVANLLKGILIVVVLFTAIEQLGVKTELAQNIFLLVLATIMFTFSLVLGIGLGIGLKDEFKPMIKKYKKKQNA